MEQKPNQAYNDRVRALATEMAQCRYGKELAASWADLDKEEQDQAIQRKIPDAKVALKHMAEQFVNGWSSGVLHANSNEGYKRDDCLKRLSLIPGQEDGKPASCPENERCDKRNWPEGTCDCFNGGLLTSSETEGGQNG